MNGKGGILLSAALLFALFAAPAAKGGGCKVKAARSINIAGSLEKRTSYPYQDGGMVDDRYNAQVTVYQCEQAGTAGQFLMVGFGGFVHGWNLDNAKVSYDEQIGLEVCQLRNAPLPLKGKKQRQARHSRSHNFLKSCVTRKVRQISKKPLYLPPGQQNCQFKKTADHEAVIQGGACFVKVFPDSEFHFSFEIKPECLQAESLGKRGWGPTEVAALMTTSLVSKPEKHAADLEPIGLRPVHFYLEPLEQQLSLSSDWSRLVPRYVNIFEVPEVRLGTPSFVDYPQATKMNVPLFVSNICKKKSCHKGVCASSCDFSKPVVGEFSLYEKKGSRFELVRSWFEGAVAPPNWQGFVNFEGTFVSGVTLREDRRYRIDVKFKDPKWDFAMLTNSMSPLFRPIPGIPSVNFLSRLNKGLPQIPKMEPIPQVEEIPEIPSWDEHYAGGSFKTIGGFRGISDFTYWPPVYTKICNEERTRCVEPSQAPYLQLRMKFTTNQADADGQWSVRGLSFGRKSKVLSNYSVRKGQLPQLSCPWETL